MEPNTEILDLVRQAAVGNKDSMQKLLEATRPRLFAYLMRLTMDYHLAEDLLQDVQTEIVMSLWRLNKPSLFWPWIYKHAWGKVRHHYRDTRRHKTIFLSDMEKDFFDGQITLVKKQEHSGFNDTQTEILFEAIYGAMKKIGLKQRSVLTMRCFEDMSFHDIGEFLECSETNARVLFFRARNKLKSHLRGKGVRANRMFLPALGLFGAITSKTVGATPAATVSVPTVEIGFGASFLGFLTTKLGILTSGLVSALLAWVTLANLLVVAIITAVLVPVILVAVISMAFDD